MSTKSLIKRFNFKPKVENETENEKKDENLDDDKKVDTNSIPRVLRKHRVTTVQGTLLTKEEGLLLKQCLTA